MQEQLDSMSQTGDEKDKTIADLNDKITTIENEKNELQNENNSLTSKATELTNLKETLSKVTAAEGQILKNYTAYKDGKLITGIMENYTGKTVTASTITENGDNAEITIPSAGYYGTDSKVSISMKEIKRNIKIGDTKGGALNQNLLIEHTGYVYVSMWNNGDSSRNLSTCNIYINDTLYTTITCGNPDGAVIFIPATAGTYIQFQLPSGATGLIWKEIYTD